MSPPSPGIPLFNNDPITIRGVADEVITSGLSFRFCAICANPDSGVHIVDPRTPAKLIGKGWRNSQSRRFAWGGSDYSQGQRDQQERFTHRRFLSITKAIL